MDTQSGNLVQRLLDINEDLHDHMELMIRENEALKLQIQTGRGAVEEADLLRKALEEQKEREAILHARTHCDRSELIGKLSSLEETNMELSYRVQELEQELENRKDVPIWFDGVTNRDQENFNEVEYGKLLDKVPQVRIPLDDQLLQAAERLKRITQMNLNKITDNPELTF